jgi:uncharacterized protein (DUF1330 family)
MSAYFVVELEVTNPAAMEPYGRRSAPRSEQYGGRILVRAGATELIEGGPAPKRIVIPGIRGYGILQALVQLTRIPENPVRPPRQLDRTRLRRRGRQLAVKL